MKILLLTQYYPPETGAPQNRLSSLVRHLQKLGHTVDVLTAMPNYPTMEVYEGYRGKMMVREEDSGTNIIRSWIYVRKSKSVIPRLLNYFSFVFSSAIVGTFFTRKQDLIICESPPLFLGITALYLRIIKRAGLVMNISDLWPESAEKLGIVTNKTMLSLAYALEKRLYKKSNLVSCQTQGIQSNIVERFPSVKTCWFPNGVDFAQMNLTARGTEFRASLSLTSDDFVVMYAGIIGHAQGLDVIIRCADKMKDTQQVRFVLVGDGPDKERLKGMVSDLKLNNVLFAGHVPSKQMSEVVASCDAFIVPLKKSDLFLGAVPSKLFEPLALQKPVLLGVDGEARSLFVDQAKAALYFEPENSEQLHSGIVELHNSVELRKELGANGLEYVRKNFDRESLARKFEGQLLSLLNND